MKIVEPSVELWQQEDAKSHVVRCARVCYGRESGNDDATYKRLLNNKHLSMFRHESVYAAIPFDHVKNMFHSIINEYMECPYIKWCTINDYVYISTNGNFFLNLEKNNPTLYYWIVQYRIDEEDIAAIPYCFKHLIRYTFAVVTQISTSRELNRVSPNNIAEQSTRYVTMIDKHGAICRPHWLSVDSANAYMNNVYFNKIDLKESLYLTECERDFITYNKLLAMGLLPQDARGKLPIDTATKCVYTYTIDEWRAIIDLRYYGTTGKPHPNAKIIAGMIRDKLIELGHEFRN